MSAPRSTGLRSWEEIHRLQATGACNNAAGGSGLRSMGRNSAPSWGSFWALTVLLWAPNEEFWRAKSAFEEAKCGMLGRKMWYLGRRMGRVEMPHVVFVWGAKLCYLWRDIFGT